MSIHKVVRIQVRFQDNLLCQTKQLVKSTNKFRYRRFPNISETIEHNETPEEAVIRGLKEELNLLINPSRLIYLGYSHESKPSVSTKQLKDYIFWDYYLEIEEQEFNSVSLSIDEGEVVTFFRWKKVKHEWI
jgi:hypothetical protein